jgi:hypothetical protein
MVGTAQERLCPPYENCTPERGIDKFEFQKKWRREIIAAPSSFS